MCGYSIGIQASSLIPAIARVRVESTQAHLVAAGLRRPEPCLAWP